MEYNGMGKIWQLLLLAIILIGLMTNGQTVFAANNTVSIYIGDGEDARHHMSLNIGGLSEEYRYELKGYEAKSSVYTSSDESVFQIVKTGDGRCKVKGLKEGTGWVILTIKTKDNKELTERVYISVYKELENCEATAIRETGLYRGAAFDAEVENNYRLLPKVSIQPLNIFPCLKTG